MESGRNSSESVDSDEYARGSPAEREAVDDPDSGRSTILSDTDSDSPDGWEQDDKSLPHWNALRRQFVWLVHHLNWQSTLDLLLQDGVIETNDYSEIEELNGHRSKRRRLLLLMRQKGEHACKVVLSLIKGQQQQLKHFSAQQGDDVSLVTSQDTNYSTSSVDSVTSSTEKLANHLLFVQSSHRLAHELLSQQEETGQLTSWQHGATEESGTSCQDAQGKDMPDTPLAEENPLVASTQQPPTGGSHAGGRKVRLRYLSQNSYPQQTHLDMIPVPEGIGCSETSQMSVAHKQGMNNLSEQTLAKASCPLHRKKTLSTKEIQQDPLADGDSSKFHHPTQVAQVSSSSSGCSIQMAVQYKSAPELAAHPGMFEATIAPNAIMYCSSISETNLAYIVEDQQLGRHHFDQSETWMLQFRQWPTLCPICRSASSAGCDMCAVSKEADRIAPNVLVVKRVPIPDGFGATMVMDVRPRCKSSKAKDGAICSSLPEKRLLVMKVPPVH